jgi:hypothetical protein
MSEPWFDFMGLKPAPQENQGLPELQEVLGRLSAQAGLGHTPEQLAHIANHLYSGNQFIQGSPYGPDSAELDQQNWRRLAELSDHALQDPQGELFGRPAAELRSAMWKGWSGPGWSAQEEAALGRPKQPYELSPGDRTSHQWLRDRQYLNDILDRENVTPPPSGAAAYVGPTSNDQLVNTNIDNALKWYAKGKDATHSQTPYSMVAGPNFRAYTSDAAAGNWMVNPDSYIGHLNTKVFSPSEDAANQVAMTDTENDGYTPFGVTPARDFFSNLREHGGRAGSDASNKAEAAQFMTHSPRLPAGGSGNLTAEDRIRMIREAQTAYEKSANKEGDDYYRQKTGGMMSPMDSFMTKVGSSLLDPTILFSGLLGMFSKGAKAATVASKVAPPGFVGTARNLATKAAKGVAAEGMQEGAENVGIMGGFGSLMPDGQKQYDSASEYWKDTYNASPGWFKPKPMTETIPDFENRMIEQEKDRVKAKQDLQKMNRAVTKPGMSGNPADLMGFSGG